MTRIKPDGKHPAFCRLCARVENIRQKAWEEAYMLLKLIFRFTPHNMKCAPLLRIILSMAPLLVLSTSDVKVVKGEEKDFGPAYDWPMFDQFGQISAVDVDSVGNVYVFHRGNRQWDYSSFSPDNVFRDKDKGPIPNETIVVLDSDRGALLKRTGANLFYLPHGLTIDSDRNVWVTDVALHQVLKYPPIDLDKRDGNLGKAILTLGVPFEPGSDEKHFCKPTGVAVDKETKEFYVSDGYCNSRIIKYGPHGNQLLKLGRSSIGSPLQNAYMLNVPHALALAQQEQTLFVADRENLRVASYNFQSGKFKRSYAEELRSRLFSVAYSPLQGGLLFALTNDKVRPTLVAVYNSELGKLILSFSPKSNFTNPHDLAVSHDGRYCYVVELKPYKVWKFNLDMGKISQLNHGGDSDANKSKEVFEEPLPAESKVDRASNSEESNSSLATGLIVSIVMITFLVFMVHYYTRKGNYRRYKSRRLILDENEGGIRLT